MVVKKKERKGKNISVSIVSVLESIVDASTCEDFKRWELKSQILFDASRNRKIIPWIILFANTHATQLVSFSCNYVAETKRILSHLALIIGCLRGSGTCPISTLIRSQDRARFCADRME